MERRRRRGRLLLLLLFVGALTPLLSACGLGADRTATVIGNKSVPYGLLNPSPPTSATDTATGYLTIYLSGPKRLVTVSRLVPEPVSVGSALAALANGPTSAEAAEGLESPMSTATPLGLVNLRDGTATVRVGPSFTQLGGQEQIVAMAQLVYTLTDFPHVKSVLVRIDGRGAMVPTGSGTLSSKPVGRPDYAALRPI